MTKKGSSFGYENSHVLRGKVNVGDIFVRGSVYFFYKGCSEDFFYLFFSFSFRYIVFVHQSCDHLVIANLVFI